MILQISQKESGAGFTEENAVLNIFQKGFNYSQDGPGNRLIYHLSSCNLFCPWCSNPEGLSTRFSEALTVSELLDEALSCRMMFFDGGGVTLTGGEVACQQKAAGVFLKKLLENGINTCIETNASLPETKLLFPYTDTVIADCKSADENTLKEVTGAALETVSENLFCRVRSGKPLLVRVPLIHGFNTGKENAGLFAGLFSRLMSEASPGMLSFEMLTYHEFGKEKYIKAGMEYKFSDGFTSSEEQTIFRDTLNESGITLINT